MKTAEEYIPDSMPCADVWKNIVREIQLDAMKEGMTMAARLCEGNEDYMPANNDECFDDIIKARDNLKELP